MNVFILHESILHLLKGSPKLKWKQKYHQFRWERRYGEMYPYLIVSKQRFISGITIVDDVIVEG